MRIYIASQWWDKKGEGEKFIAAVMSICDNYNIKYFSPKHHNLILPDASIENKRQGFNKNVNEVKQCNLLIANTQGANSDYDPGVLIEMGIAHANNVPIILFNDKIEKNKLNLMLAMLAEGIANNYEELHTEIHNFINNKTLHPWLGDIE